MYSRSLFDNHIRIVPPVSPGVSNHPQEDVWKLVFCACQH